MTSHDSIACCAIGEGLPFLRLLTASAWAFGCVQCEPPHSSDQHLRRMFGGLQKQKIRALCGRTRTAGAVTFWLKGSGLMQSFSCGSGTFAAALRSRPATILLSSSSRFTPLSCKTCAHTLLKTSSAPLRHPMHAAAAPPFGKLAHATYASFDQSGFCRAPVPGLTQVWEA